MTLIVKNKGVLDNLIVGIEDGLWVRIYHSYYNKFLKGLIYGPLKGLLGSIIEVPDYEYNNEKK